MDTKAKEKMRTLSRYSYIFESEKYGPFIYNAVTNSFVRVSRELAERVRGVREWDEAALDSFSEAFRQVLLGHKIVVDEGADDAYYTQKQYAKLCSAFNPHVLGLTVATTTGCDFACPYCYEQGAEAQVMDERVEGALVDYVSASPARVLDVTWYGGEPLLNFPTIRRLSEAFAGMDRLTAVNYSMITNGYYLDTEKAEYLKQYRLRSVQITVDGLPATHNLSRRAKSGEPTYDRIVGNIDTSARILPETRFGVRVNVGKHNGGEYAQLYRELTERWRKLKNVTVYFAFVEDYGQCDSCCYSSLEKLEFVRRLRTEHGIWSRGFYPQSALGTCVANSAYNYVVAPNGDLYKCWADIGQADRVVGTLFEKRLTNYALVADYAVGYDKYADPRCRECFLFPVCEGGCPGHRYNNAHSGHHHEVCPYAVRHIDTVLEMIYEDYQTNIKPKQAQ